MATNQRTFLGRNSIHIIVLALAVLIVSESLALAQNTAFTYQGRLTDGSVPANGSYDFRFILYDADIGGSQHGPIVTNVATAVSNGLFTVTLDFGDEFPGTARWLEIGIRTNGAGSFTPLIPRQALTASPYAITAGNVVSNGLAGSFGNAISFNNAANQFTGTFSGNGAGLTNLNTVTLGGFGASSFWNIGGNTGTTSTNFLGTVDNQPVVIRANNLKVMQISYASNAMWGYSPNVILGNGANTAAVGVVGATISGGGTTLLPASNSVTADFGTVVGGLACVAGNYAVAGGAAAQATGDYSVAFGSSTAYGAYSTAMGASSATSNSATALGSSTASGPFSTAMGFSTASGSRATAMGSSLASGNSATAMGNNAYASGDASVAMGINTQVGGDYSLVAGSNASCAYSGSFVWNDGSAGGFGSTLGDQFLIHAANGVGIGTNHPADALHVVSSTSSPQAQLTQLNPSGYTRLRMNVGTYPFWEMDVSPGATPALQFWNSNLRMSVDYNGNVSATSFNPSSDRNLKEHFTAINPGEVLKKVAALPITHWNFKTDAGTEHIGPMAQDFYAAFGLGQDDKHIATVDADGVALAAIQGLNQKLAQKEKQIRNQAADIADLKSRLEKLEQTIKTKGNH